MNWKASPPAIETAAISAAALSLGSAVAFAVAQVSPYGAGLIGAGFAGVSVAVGGWVLVGLVDRRRVLPVFAIPSGVAGNISEEDVLLLDEIVEGEPLLLDDPLPLLRDDSRVVRLFAALPADAEPAPALVGPGEMIARIEDFLGQSRAGLPEQPAGGASKAASEDASAALHSALADIRRSLRQA